MKQVEKTVAQGVENLYKWVNLSQEEAVRKIAPFGKKSHYKDDSWRNISPFVISSVLWSLYSFLRTPDNYLEPITTAIGVGGDVDTIAAMTGAISGAFLGIKELHANLAHQLNDQDT